MSGHDRETAGALPRGRLVAGCVLLLMLVLMWLQLHGFGQMLDDLGATGLAPALAAVLGHAAVFGAVAAVSVALLAAGLWRGRVWYRGFLVWSVVVLMSYVLPGLAFAVGMPGR